jgi:hypothetical protein
MARKKLLSEGEVRQFMKLANLAPLSENYFSANPIEEEFEEEEMEMGGPGPMDDVPPEDEIPLEDEEGLEGGDDNEALLARVVQAVADELGVEAEIEGVGEEGGEDLEADVDMEMDGDELDMAMAPEEEEEIPGNGLYEGEVDEGFVDMKAARRPETRKGAVQRDAPPRDPSTACRPGQHWNAELKQCDPGEAKTDQQATGTGGLDEEAIVAEVTRRVARRLGADKQKEELAEQLAQRIFNRLTAK